MAENVSDLADPGPTSEADVASEDRSTKRPRTGSMGIDRLSTTSLDITGAACERCHARKVKCGGEFPSCVGCTRANVRCMVHDPTAPRAYTRQEFQQLYEKAKRLEMDLGGATGLLMLQGNTAVGQGEESAADIWQLQQREADAICDRPRKTRKTTASSLLGHQEQAPTENRFVGQEDTAFGFFLSHLHPSRVRGATTIQSERHGLRTPRMPYHAPHSFPSRETALIAIRDYFQHHEPAQPVLSPDLVYETLDSYTLNTTDQPAIEAAKLFRLFMAVAIGSIRSFRNGVFEPHPFGYFTAALEKWTPSMSSFNTIDDIEHLLLIAQFGLFYDIGCSVWELGRFSMRTAVELGLHRSDPAASITDNPSMTDRSRRVFWMVYMLDRSSSYTLGRPFAIDDTSITAPLPNPAASHTANHNWRIGLSRLASQIRCNLRSKRKTMGVDSAPDSQQTLHVASSEFSSTIALLRKFHLQLQEWRRQAPSTEEPTCLIEAPQYLDLLYQEARLGLLRAAIDKLAISPLSLPKSLLRLSLSAACSIISTFEYLRNTSLWTCTRAEAHLIFVTSLVVLSLTQASGDMNREAPEQAQTDMDDDPWIDFLDDGCFQVTPARVSDIISTAGQLLSWVCEALPDFAVCARIFEDTRRTLRLERLGDPRRADLEHEAVVDTQTHIAPRGNVVSSEAGTGPSWMNVTDNATGSGPSAVDNTAFQGQSNFNEEVMTITEAAPYMGSFDINAALTTEGFEVPAAPGVNGLSWPLSNFEGMAAIDACFSGYVWDTNVPWEGSPSVTMDSV